MSKKAEEQDSSWADVSLLVCLPAAVRAALVLNIPKIIDSASRASALSAEEICRHVGGRQEGQNASLANLEKILDWLSCNGISSQTVEGEGACKVKKYRHSPKSRCLSTERVAHTLLMFTDPQMATV